VQIIQFNLDKIFILHISVLIAIGGVFSVESVGTNLLIHSKKTRISQEENAKAFHQKYFKIFWKIN
jgi:hypothetical protein